METACLYCCLCLPPVDMQGRQAAKLSEKQEEEEETQKLKQALCKVSVMLYFSLDPVINAIKETQ